MVDDFDFLIGNWKVMNTQLKRWLSDCNEWVQFESSHIEKKYRLGEGNVALHQYIYNNVFFERSVLRKYDGRFDFWEINRIDQMSALALRSLKGTFWRNKGSFISTGVIQGKDVLVSAEWTKITPNVAYWEQHISPDNGVTWELIWTMDFIRQL